jgi:hypothetical protein
VTQFLKEKQEEDGEDKVIVYVDQLHYFLRNQNNDVIRKITRLFPKVGKPVSQNKKDLCQHAMECIWSAYAQTVAQAEREDDDSDETASDAQPQPAQPTIVEYVLNKCAANDIPVKLEMVIPEDEVASKNVDNRPSSWYETGDSMESQRAKIMRVRLDE